MTQITPLKEFMESNPENPIEVIERYISNYVDENWQNVLHTNRDKLQKAYIEAGDMAYGTFLNLLFLPIHRQFKELGIRPEPKLPGDFDISREWGNTEQTDQQRWMWSSIHSPHDGPLGTIVTIVFHDHTQFRVPRQPRILALNETNKEDVVAALSLMSPDFGQALEFTVEYEEYLRSQQN
ncbi:DUF6022 family protein [Paenibacillus sp. P96]|uniref:DUF6022 family protein n=1 Tax=Paenibacillus zeirhizosphaerae TaxID=2987519 RepID=A0ABT9FKY8_9BACL|nr:DUF6022 family protein [Paenibacillus sp. P96]MDP4095391.1 DUF6022 family protein [Paenibacillus sp. P96]